MTSEELLYQMALTMIPEVGAITAKKLIAYIGSPEAIFREKLTTLEKVPGIGRYLALQVKNNMLLKEAGEELSNMEKSGISCLYYQDPDYPWKLKNCEDGPLLLFFRGKREFNRSKYLSVVGTRSATHEGKDICRNMIENLAGKYPDLVIVSGLAYGIDIIAHRAALEYGLDTIAVLAHGLNTVYPGSHRETALRITKQGSLVSDFHSNTKPERNNFLRRNRIIAGLSDATLVVESGEKGGALITAGMASSYNREVLAVPGRVTDLFSLGCNSLIKKNIAALTESASDIEFMMNWEVTRPPKVTVYQLVALLTDEERRILKVIRDCPYAGPEIISIRAGMALPGVMAMLMQMELRNWITVLPGNTYKIMVRVEDD